jgi:hypothetical protein
MYHSRLNNLYPVKIPGTCKGNVLAMPPIGYLADGTAINRVSIQLLTGKADANGWAIKSNHEALIAGGAIVMEMDGQLLTSIGIVDEIKSLGESSGFYHDPNALLPFDLRHLDQKGHSCGDGTFLAKANLSNFGDPHVWTHELLINKAGRVIGVDGFRACGKLSAYREIAVANANETVREIETFKVIEIIALRPEDSVFWQPVEQKLAA